MKKYYYDLHNHSCLSPCADDDNTPNNIAGMAHLCELDIVALTDHNSCKNCPAFFDAANRYGIIPIAGMELTTAEDIHMVCLFEKLDSAMDFDSYLQKRRVFVKNNPRIFGNQLILNGMDEQIGTEHDLLINATTITVDEVPGLVADYGGICYPAHIDRDANGIIAILGTVPKDLDISCVEVRDKESIAEFKDRFGLNTKTFIVSSDAHSLGDIQERSNYFELNCESEDSDDVRHSLFALLRKKI